MQTNGVNMFIRLLVLLVVFASGMMLRDCLNEYFHTKTEATMLQEDKDEDYLKGIDFINEGRIPQAINSFEKVVEKNPDAIKSHLQLGTLKKQENQPIEAIYHLKQYLRRANLNNPKIIEDLIKSAEQDYLRTIPGRPFDSYKLSDVVEKKYEETRLENDKLKRELAIAEARVKELERYAARSGTLQPPTNSQVSVPVKKPVPAANPTPPPPPQPAQTYVVKSGDTLGKISKHFYGTSARWQEIFDYNRDVLSDPAKLRAGMELKIPPK